MRNQKTIARRKAKTKKQWNEEMKKGRSLAYSGKNTGTIVHPDKRKYNRKVEKRALNNSSKIEW